MCVCCPLSPHLESVDHILSNSQTAIEVWGFFNRACNMRPVGPSSAPSVAACWWASSPTSRTLPLLKGLIPSFILWELRMARNKAHFDSQGMLSSRIIGNMLRWEEKLGFEQVGSTNQLIDVQWFEWRIFSQKIGSSSLFHSPDLLV
ncbi:uncharacterized protein LOC131223490 isoform X2 [Magnolia sinica]|uniref:uncharacterized protein LOC131223490 isoform X2 n=1 Tax=Magnolia sinica TaxID=86752 RepID=UPI002658E311|nr:uncharacterized protein LOC131223490 isoform X2 [Magnolia sinica]